MTKAEKELNNRFKKLEQEINYLRVLIAAGTPGTGVSLDTSGFTNILDSLDTNVQLALNSIDAAVGVANGFASLNGSGLVPSTQLPSYVDDVEEYADFASLPNPGETGKIYITIDNNKQYRWSGSVYVELGGGISISGTPVNNQIAIWTDASTVEGDANFTLSGSSLKLGQSYNTAGILDIYGHSASQGGRLFLHSGGNYSLIESKFEFENTLGKLEIKGALTGTFISYDGNTSQLAFPMYGGGTITGTPTQALAVDVSGNVIEAPLATGDVTKVGTPANNQLSYWTGDGTLAAEQYATRSFSSNIQRITLGSPDAIAGGLDLLGRNDTVGGFIALHNGGTGDTDDNFYEVKAFAGEFVIRAGTTGDVLTYTSDTQNLDFAADTVQMSAYGGGTITGTATQSLLVDVSGNIIEGDLPVTKVGTPVNNQVGIWTGDGTMEGDVGLTFGSSVLYVGVNDVTNGTIQLRGNSTTTGGQIMIFNGASADSNDDGYRVRATNGVFEMVGTTTGNFLTYTSATQVVNFPKNVTMSTGSLHLGVSDGVNSILRLYGGAVTTGGSIEIYAGALKDSYDNQYRLTVVDDKLILSGVSTGTVWDYNSSIGSGIFTISKNTVLSAYGAGTITGTPTQSLLVDVSGNIIEGDLPVTKVGTPVDNQLAVWTGDGTIEGSAQHRIGGSGNISFGTDHVTQASIYIYGDNGNNGGRIYLYNGANGDTNDDNYSMQGVSGVFTVKGASTGNFLTYTSATQVVDFPKSVAQFGTDDTTAGLIRVYGDAAGVGGSVHLYNGATGDTDDEYYRIYGNAGTFEIIGVSTGEFFKYTSATQVVSITGAVTSDQTVANINSTGNTALTTKEYVDDAVSHTSGMMYDEDNTDAFTVNAQDDFHVYHTNGLASAILTGWIFDAGGAGTSHAVSSVADGAATGVDIEVTTGTSHGLAVDDIVSLTNMSVAAYNGVYVVKAIISVTQFEVAAVFSATATGTVDQAATLEADTGTSGTFMLTWGGSATSATNNDVFDWVAYKGATQVAGSKSRRRFGTGGDYGDFGRSALITIAEGDKLSFGFANTSGSGNMTMRHYTYTIHNVS